VFRDMEKWTEIRRRVLRNGESIRGIQRETGLHFTTVKKILTHSSPPPFQCNQRPRPKIGPFLDRIGEILSSDKDLPRKQRHTAKRIFEVIRDEGYEGGYTQVKEAVRELKSVCREVYMPLVHKPGDAQADFGFALVKMCGVLRKVAFFAMALPHSDGMFVAAYERECTETFQDGHVRAFAFFGGVPRRISYDNSKLAISQIVGGRGRKLTDGFLQLQSHYLFEEHFCRVARPNEKGVVEGVVKFARLNFFVPVPAVESFEELNGYLEQRCRDDLKRRLRGKSATKGELLKQDQAAFYELPSGRFDACRRTSTTVNSLSLVRFDCNDYSVPVRYAHRPVVAKGYVDRVFICKDDAVIARHARLWGKEDVSFEPVHYLALLERKPGAFDYARPLSGWNLPECFDTLRRALEEQARSRGVKEFIGVLRLLEKHPLDKVSRAVEKALRVRAYTRDAVAQFLYPAEQWQPATFRLEGREHLKGVYVQPPDLEAYQQLLGGQN